MIKEKLNKLVERNMDPIINKSMLFINENYDENTLKFILSNTGIKINENLILFYYGGVGFRCEDINEKYYGKSPLCQNIERYLNRIT
jgi:hypothetical protein